MQDIVTANQSAFICGRHLHDNFLLVRQVARKIHARKEAGVFLKLDISRAFDSISWPFLSEVMRRKGFGLRWFVWIAILLRTASTKVLVNGVPGRSFWLTQGLRQGDPVSPLLFIIAMDALSCIMVKGAEEGVLKPFTGIRPNQSVSIYADDVALFVRTNEVDLRFVTMALKAFRVSNLLQCELGKFPCKYLGLQLAIHQLKKRDWQPMLDKAKKCAPGWQRGLLQRSGRLVLVKSVIAAKPIHHFMITDTPGWVFEELDKWMRAFFWAGKDQVPGVNCMVAWNAVCKPTCFGGLGIKNLKLQGLALRVRWEWLKSTD